MDTTPSASGYYAQAHDYPLTDRLLAHLPGPRWLWIPAWVLFPLMHYVVFAQLLRMSGYGEHPGLSLSTRLASHAVQSYMLILSFWASRRLAADIRALGPTVDRLSQTPGDGSSPPFAGLSSLAGPLGFIAVVTIVETVQRVIIWGVVPAILFVPYQGVWIVPMMTLFWVYVVFFIGLDRLGRKRLNLGSFPEDLSLGLGPVGATAFQAFLIFSAFAVPFIAVSVRDLVDLTVGLVFFVVGVGVFFLSTWRLHRQMVEVKRTHLAHAGALYAEAYGPLRAQMKLATLQASAALMSAAEALQRRALAIQEWPFDDRTMTRIVGISTGVLTAVIARFVLRAVGF